MKPCERCQTLNPVSARYCMQCGLSLPMRANMEEVEVEPKPAYNTLAISLLASICLSLILVYVFKLPIFFLAGFLPLLWPKKRRNS